MTPNKIHAPIRALFLDIDGTILGKTDLIAPRVVEAIGKARAIGCEVTLCTGRARFTARPIAALLPPLGYAVTSNGGVVTHLGTGETLLRRLLPVPLALQVAQAMVAAGAQPYVYEDTPGDAVENNRVLYHPDLPVGEWISPTRHRPYRQLLEHLPFEPVSVSAFGPEAIMRPLAAQLQAQFADALSVIGVGTHRSWGVEVYAKGVSKQLGLETIAARLDVNREEIMAVGDHLNDIEMLRWAGIGVAMQDAPPEVLDAADYVTGSVEEDGVAQAIKRFVLGVRR